MIPSANDFTDFTEKVTNCLKNKPLVLKISNGPVLFVGDIHGFYSNIIHAFNIARKKSVGTIVFLGDYADRGPEQIKSLINILYSYARSEGLDEVFDFIDTEFSRQLPFKIIALRGNHEDVYINKKYGLQKEFADKYDPNYFPEIELNNLYSNLPVMVETSWKTLGFHGGIPFHMNLNNSAIFLKKLNRIKTPYFFQIEKDPQSDVDKIIKQILWNDPDESIKSKKSEFLRGYRGNDIYRFNEIALDSFLNDGGLKRIVRSHEASRGSYQIIWGGKLINIFSASPYFGYCNTTAYYLEYDDGKGEVINHKGDILKKVESISN